MGFKRRTPTGPAIDTAVFFAGESGSDYSLRQELAIRAIDEIGTTARTVWAFLRYHIDEARWSIPRAHARFDPARIGAVARAALELLNSGIDDAELERALTRVACVVGATYDLETRPTPDTLERATAWLDRYKTLVDQPVAAYENWDADDRYAEARARARAWEVVLIAPRVPDRDFAFIADYIYPSDLEWAMDPLVALPDFQEWARVELIERRVTQPSEPLRGFRPDMGLRWSITRPASEMPSIHLGRLLAAQLAGIDSPEIARMLCGEPGAPPLFAQLLASGLDPNTVVNDESLLELAARLGDAEVVAHLLDAGASVGPDTDGLLAVASGRRVKALLAEALGRPAPEAPTGLPRTVTSLEQWPGLEEVAYDGLAGAERVETLSDSDYYIADLFGNTPDVVYRAAGSVRCPTALEMRLEDHGYLVVDGDLNVDGVLHLEATDAATVLVVNGDLTAGALIVSREFHLYVRGAMSVGGGAIFALGDAGAAHVFGVVTAPVVFDLGRMPPAFHAEPPVACLAADSLRPELLRDERYPNMAAILERLTRGEPIVTSES